MTTVPKTLMRLAGIFALATIAMVPVVDICKTKIDPYATTAIVNSLNYPTTIDDGPGWVNNASCLKVYAYSEDVSLYGWVLHSYPNGGLCMILGNAALSRQQQLKELDTIIQTQFAPHQQFNVYAWRGLLYYQDDSDKHCMAAVIMISLGAATVLLVAAASFIFCATARETSHVIWHTTPSLWGTPPPRYEEAPLLNTIMTPPGTPSEVFYEPEESPPSYDGNSA